MELSWRQDTSQRRTQACCDKRDPRRDPTRREESSRSRPNVLLQQEPTAESSLDCSHLPSSQFDGVPIGGREGQLKWFNVDALPFDEMWEDDQYWYRLGLDGTRFDGWFYFSGDFEKLIDHRIEVKSLPSQIES